MRRNAITLDGFERKFASDPDPWRTWTSSYEQVKRRHLGQVIGPGRYGRVLEVGAGNGSNTHMLASRALRLTVTEGTLTGVRLIREMFDETRRIKVCRLDISDRLPEHRYDLIVISEILYYLKDKPFRNLVREVKRTLQPGGVLVLAHHTGLFGDAARNGGSVHRQFLSQLSRFMVCDFDLRTGRYSMVRARRCRVRPPRAEHG